MFPTSTFRLTFFDRAMRLDMIIEIFGKEIFIDTSHRSLALSITKLETSLTKSLIMVMVTTGKLA